MAASVSAEPITHESELAKLEEQRVTNLESHGTAILTVVLAIAAFAASAVDGDTLENNALLIAVAVLFMLFAAGFAVAARGPRALKARFWTKCLPGYARLEQRAAAAEQAISGLPPGDDTAAILQSWRARRAVSSYLAENKALWVTCSLTCLLLAFITAGCAALVIVY